MKLLTAEMPVNESNVAVPLKLIRTVRGPKMKPNLLRRFHKVEMNTPKVTVPAVNKVAPPQVDLSQVRVEFMDPEAQTPTRIHLTAEKPAIKLTEPDFCGFSPSKQPYEVGRWPQALSWQEPEPIKAVTPPPEPISVVKLLPTVPTRRFISKVMTKQSILDKLKGSQKVKDLKANHEQITPTLFKPSTSRIADLPKKPERFDLNLVTSTPIVQRLEKAESEITATSSTSTIIDTATSSQTSTLVDEDPWQDDIFSVIGGKRIEEIDENLTQIPNLVTGNAIETENVELKLIINHMKKLLGVSSIQETLNMTPGSFSQNMSRTSAAGVRSEY